VDKKGAKTTNGVKKMKCLTKKIILFIFIFFFKLNFKMEAIDILKLSKEWYIGKEIKEPIFYLFDIDSMGNIYLPVDGEIRVYSRNGILLKKIGKKDEFEGAIVGVVVDNDGYIYVAEEGLKVQIRKLDNNGKFIKKWGKKIEKEDLIQRIRSGKDMDDYEFFVISNIEKDCLGNIYVSDVQRIKKFDAQGNFLFSWKIPELKYFDILEIDCEGNFILLDRSKREISIYNSKLEKIEKIKLPCEINGYKVFPESKPESDQYGDIYLLAKGSPFMDNQEESYFILKMFKYKKDMKAYKIEKLYEEKSIFPCRFSVDNQGKNIFILAFSERKGLKNWFLQVYEIPH
jgi:hypothetical protein